MPSLNILVTEANCFAPYKLTFVSYNKKSYKSKEYLNGVYN